MPGPMGGRPPRGVKPTVANPGKVFKRIIGFVAKNYLLQCIVVLVCIVLTVFSTIQGTMFMKTLIDQYIMPLMQQTVPDYTELLHANIRVACFYAVGVIAAYVNTRMMVYVTQGTMRSLRDELFVHMESLPIKYFDTHAHGDIMSIYTNDVDTLRQMISQSIPQLINSSITIIGVLASMIILNIPLTLLTLVLVGLMLVVTKKATGMSGKYFVKQQKNLGEVNGFIEEMMGGQKVVKVFCHEEQAEAEFEQYNQELREKQLGAQFFGGIMGPVMGNMSQLNYTLTAVVGGVLCVLRGFDIGGLTVFVNYSRQFSRPINELSMQMNTIFSALAGAERVFAVMDEKPEEPDAADALSITEKDGNYVWNVPGANTAYTLKKEDPAFHAEIVLQDVTFGYLPGKTILKHITLYAKPGQKIAFVGSTGAGKTTITNLINRFYDIEGGRITIDGVDIMDIDRASLRKNIAMVLQDTHLFAGTVMENIRYGRLDATDEEVIAAAKTASAHSFIMRLENGYDTVLEGDGANLSQGQRQLLNIARAAISKAPILILDEATSSVDTRTEKHIEQGMDRLMAERTTLVIAHRLSTVRNADAIMVLENGSIIERGDHEALLAQKGRYYKLYTGLSELE